MKEVLLLKCGEIVLKGANRRTFEDKLKQFMKDSDSRIADNRMYADRGRSRRRK